MAEKKKNYRLAKNSTAEGGYINQRNYAQRHKGEVYEPKIRIRAEYRPQLDSLLQQTGKSITELFLSAVEEKYGVILQKKD